MHVEIGQYVITGQASDYKVQKWEMVEATETKEEHPKLNFVGYYPNIEQCFSLGICGRELSADDITNRKKLLLKIRELKKLAKTLFADLKPE